MRKYIFLISLLSLIPFGVQAATELYLDPAAATVGPGTTFETDVRVNVEDVCVNTFEITIDFDSDYMQLVEFLTGDSLLSVWVQKPDSAGLSDINRDGVIRFSGGIPGGYCGRLPGDPGDSNILARLVFKIPSLIVDGGDKSELNIRFSEPLNVYVNDGQGTADTVKSTGAVLAFEERLIQSDNEWKQRIADDDIPPEPFVVELHRRDDMFDGKYFLVFDTQDKQTGVDHFEVLELRPGQSLGGAPKQSWWERFTGQEYGPAVWKKASINYLLEDQTLGSTIRVKAIDKAGNERMVEFVPPSEVRTELQAASQKKQNMLLLTAMAVFAFLLILIGAVFAFVRWRHKRSKHNHHDESHPEDEAG